MRPCKYNTTLTVITAIGLLLPTLALGDEDRIRLLEKQLAEQKAMLEKQQLILEAMESELNSLKAVQHDTGTSNEIRTSATKSSPTFDVYGFVMADSIYDFKRVDPNWNDTLRVTTIPTQKGYYGADGEFVFSVRQSRLGLFSEFENAAGHFSVLFEAELFGVGGDAGQTTPRLRHAWATWNNIGMGQTSSNFMDGDVFPNTIDYWGPTGMVFYRNKQIRYSWPLEEDEFAIAIEDPDTALTVGKFREICIDPGCSNTFDEVFQKYNDVPDLTMRFRDNTSWGHWQVAGIARKLGVERRDTGRRSSTFGWGINTSAVVNTWGDDQLKLQVVYGEGIGNYMNDGGVDVAPKNASLVGNEAVAVPILGVVAYYDHYWNDKWSSSLGWSTIQLDTTIGQDLNEFDNGSIAQVNLLHFPRKGVLIGGELSYGERVDIDGADGYDFRAQLSLKVNFPIEDDSPRN